MFTSLKIAITNIETLIPKAVRARIFDYAITMLLSVILIISCLALAFYRLNEQFVKISDMLP